MNTAVTSTSSSTSLPFGGAMPALQGNRVGAGLERHLQQCERAQGRWFKLVCAAESVHAAITPRFFTSILVASALVCLLVEWV